MNTKSEPKISRNQQFVSRKGYMTNNQIEEAYKARQERIAERRAKLLKLVVKS